jgi:hypothetical protein
MKTSECSSTEKAASPSSGIDKPGLWLRFKCGHLARVRQAQADYWLDNARDTQCPKCSITCRDGFVVGAVAAKDFFPEVNRETQPK